MDRRRFVGALAGSVLATSRTTRAQQAPKLPLIATLSAGSAAPADLRGFDAFLALTFLARMKDLGYEDGRNMRIEVHSSGGDPQRLTELASEIARRNPDVILTTSTPATYAAKLATSTIPIVMAGTLDAQAAGLVTSLSRPGGNITGLTAISLELMAKRLQFLRELAPKLSRLGFLERRQSQLGGALADQERLGAALTVEVERALDQAAKPLGIGVQRIYAQGPDDIRDAFAELARTRVEALYVLEAPGLLVDRILIAELAVRNRLPTISGTSRFADAGGLMSYGADFADVFRKAANYVDKILKGAKPADLPVEQPSKFELVINLKTAKALGLTIPQSLLLRADRVIQ